MIESIEFKNFKALRDTKLPLSQFTLIVGPNGSGKSTALAGLGKLKTGHLHGEGIRSITAKPEVPVKLSVLWEEAGTRCTMMMEQSPRGLHRQLPESPKFHKAISGIRYYSLDANVIAEPVELKPKMELTADGRELAGVLDRLRDEAPERFEALNDQLGRWIPEFDRILFETPRQGHRAVSLRTRQGGHVIKASDLSQGTLIALALLTIAYLPEPPSILCLEEPDHGLHPRLLRDVRDALYRLAYPDGAQEKREPVQVIATTHNPYFLDLFRDHPEEIVIAEKTGLEAKFSRLSDRSDLDEILGDAKLSEVWYSGVLGGVPAGT
jgi:predicted ATPase